MALPGSTFNQLRKGHLFVPVVSYTVDADMDAPVATKLHLRTTADFGENYHGFRSKITTHSERSDAGCLIIVKW